MRPTTLRRVLSLAVLCCIIEVTSSLDANRSSPFSSSRLDFVYIPAASKNYSDFKKGPPRKELVIPSLKSSGTGNFSRKNIRPLKARSADQSDKRYDGFEFVDSPEIETDAPDLTDKANVGGSRAVENNSWKRYSNGTIIHDVRISLVHPANMGGVMDDRDALAGITLERRTLPDSNHFVNNAANNSTTVPFKSVVFENTSATDDPKNETDSSAHHLASVGILQPFINLGISINAKEPCFSECLTKCSKAESNNSFMNPPAVCIPSRLPEDGSSPGGKNISAGLPDQREEFDNNNSDLKVPPDIEIGMLKIKESNKLELGFLLEDICLSESCVLKAAEIIKRMGKSADPCNSFYNFACGGYFKSEIPDTESSRSIFSDISSDILARMYSVLKSPLTASDRLPVKLLKNFYSKCILTSPKELIMDALKELGGWPSPYSPTQRVPQHIWGGVAFNWTYGMFLEYNLVSINLTFISQEGNWMLSLDYPSFVKVALYSDSVSVLDEMERDIRIVGSALGIENSTVRRVLADLRIFMASAIKYAKVTTSNAEKGYFSLKDLQARFIHLDILKRLPSLLKTAISIEDGEMIYVSNMIYLQKVDELLRDSTVRTQEGHLVLTALRTLLVLIGTATDSVREKYCVKLTGKLFPHLFGHLYSSTFVSSSKVASAARIVSQVRDSLLSILDENVNSTTKDEISDGVSKLMFVWGHHDAIKDDLNGIARGFDENPSFLGFIKTGIWNLKRATYAYLHQSVNSTLASFIERYSEDDYGVNAFHYSQYVLIPYSALHENIFDPDVPAYFSYGGLGLIVGHELLHSVVAADGISNSAAYRNMEKCMTNQFNEFAKKHSYARVNGVLTKDENIADFGGFKVAYRAFMEWYSSRETKEKRLPGLHKFNGKQMFWLTAAANWCQKVSPDFTSTAVDKHAPPEFRVDGQFANLPEFAQDFNCPENSPMNPKEKCSLW